MCAWVSTCRNRQGPAVDSLLCNTRSSSENHPQRLFCCSLGSQDRRPSLPVLNASSILNDFLKISSGSLLVAVNPEMNLTLNQLFIKRTIMLVAMTFGSSHTDSMKKICKRKDSIGLCLVSESLWTKASTKIITTDAMIKKRTDLEAVLSSKLQDHVSSFSGCVCGIENLKTVTRVRPLTSRVYSSYVPREKILTATWPPSSLRYALTSWRAVKAHCLRKRTKRIARLTRSFTTVSFYWLGCIK